MAQTPTFYILPILVVAIKNRQNDTILLHLEMSELIVIANNFKNSDTWKNV